jgi:hypothetical protein
MLLEDRSDHTNYIIFNVHITSLDALILKVSRNKFIPETTVLYIPNKSLWWNILLITKTKINNNIRIKPKTKIGVIS